ncbi:hypothetical protein ABZW30_03170 [Kitasatospora sp. NPDC004669]|uniref:hypothetical protein n=1 Tax=Kitasatospora sp. NPDC004669 TaxID=3154555 RepID=UPI00339DAE2B
MTTATAVIDVDQLDRLGRPLERTVRLVPATGHQDQPEPPEPAADHARTRPAHCRFAMHYDD